MGLKRKFAKQIDKLTIVMMYNPPHFDFSPALDSQIEVFPNLVKEGLASIGTLVPSVFLNRFVKNLT